MNILLIHEIFVTPDQGGGTRHYEFAKYLVQMGHKVTVIASNVDYLSGRRKDKKDEVRDGIRIIYSPTLSSVHKGFLGRGLAFLSFSLSSFIEALKVHDFEIVIGTSPPLFQAVTAFAIARIKRKKFVFEVRDLWVDFARELGIIRNGFIFFLLKKVEYLLYRNSDLVIVNSPGFLSYVPQSIPREKVILIPNGVSTSDFDGATEKNMELVYKLGLLDKFVVMYTGNLGVANDLDTVLNSAILLKDFRDIVFIFIGGGIRKDEIKKQIVSKNLENVIVLDPVPKKDISKFISLADVCIASIKDTPLLQLVYPNKVFDYMASGKPTILTINGVMRDVIEKSNGGIYVPPGDSLKLKEAILYYYNNREFVILHGNNARNYVKKNFEREDIARKFEAILLRLLDKDGKV
ncbi:MAG: glycosyltransferase family 4 protein [Nitrososphaeria archaeon]